MLQKKQSIVSLDVDESEKMKKINQKWIIQNFYFLNFIISINFV